jgi:hypothetical protein
MRSNRMFWSVLLILVGLILLLSNLGLLPIDVWPLIWPSVLILLGIWILGRRIVGGGGPVTESIDIPLEGAQQARVTISHGAGRIRVSGTAAPGQLLAGQFNGGVEHTVNRSRGELDLYLRADVGRSFDFPWVWGPEATLDWAFSLSSEVPLALDMKTGASELNMDLSPLRLTDLRLETGASSSDITLPSRAGLTRVSIEGGATSVTLRVPQGVAARVTSEGGLTNMKVDPSRFLKTATGYESSKYDSAENKVEIRVDVGLSSINIL